jgi:hypothetical protein
MLRDIWRLVRVGIRQTTATDYAEALRQSADLAEMWAGVNGSQPLGTHGAATANPFANLAFLQGAVPAAGTVISLAPTGQHLGEVPIYAVELEMRMDGREPYRTTYRTVIGAGALPNWQPGRMLTFRVSPDDPHAIMLG